jgi:hypothetical protein
MAGDTVARSVVKFIYIRVGRQIRWIYPPLNKPKTLGASRSGHFTTDILKFKITVDNEIKIKNGIQGSNKY